MRAERGFTLLEVLVAFAITAMALTVLFHGTTTGLASARAASRYEEAIVRARSHLAALGRDAALAAGDAEGDDGAGFRWRLHVWPLQAAEGAAGSNFTPPTLLAVEVAIAWTDGRQRREVVLRSERLATAVPAHG
jgi:general secretion pathway protein I